MELNPERLRARDEWRERITRLINGTAVRDYLDRKDTEAADAINSPEDAS